LYIASVYIKDFRCFKEQLIEFNEGVNVIIGENNAGKTALLKALGLVFDNRSRRRLTKYDFYQGIDDFNNPPSVTVAVTLRSSGNNDTIDDKSLVATWLTKFDSPWEAQLTYEYFLPESEVPYFKKRIGATPSKEVFWEVVESLLPKYLYRIYAGEPSAKIKVEQEWLSKFDYQFLDAIRDVESELFTGSNPLLKSMLYEVLDIDLEDNDEGNTEKHKRTKKFNRSSDILKRRLIKRLSLESLFTLVKKTGAKDGGEPALGGEVSEQDIIAALRLFIKTSEFELPANYNGLGYNNLIYISLVLANLDFKTSTKQMGQNAAIFPMLLIEEPEAHLHPALQYKLLKYIDGRIKTEQKTRQLFITTHSTHITSACSLDQLISMSVDAGGISVSYPGKVFSNDHNGIKSKKYVERYLDATKSNMLFSKSVIFVEGLSEQILLPCFAEYIGCSLEDSHVSIIGVQGSNFKHFLPIFGAGCDTNTRDKYCLRRRIACLLDSDPCKKESAAANPRWIKCWPYECDNGPITYEYKKCSSVVGNLETMCSDMEDSIKMCFGVKTLEYDIALSNSKSNLLITSSCRHKDEIEEFINNSNQNQTVFESILTNEAKSALDAIVDINEKEKTRLATYYLLSIDGKGAHAFDLERQLRENLEKYETERKRFEVPSYISKAIKWVCA